MDTTTAERRRTLPEQGAVAVTVAATPEQIWSVLSDLPRTGEWSHEAKKIRWLGDATEAVAGARFAGRSYVGRITWERQCEVVAVEEPREIAWRTIRTWRLRDSTEWRFRLTPVEGGTLIEQSFRMLILGPVTGFVFWLMIPSHRDRLDALRADLVRLGEVAAAQ